MWHGLRMNYVTTTYIELDDLLRRRAPSNPKAHALDAIKASFRRFGFVTPALIDETEGSLAEGHGRIEALCELLAAGAGPPEGIRVSKSGTWLVPVVHVRLPPGQADAYRVASNRTVELGGWHKERLADVLSQIARESKGLEGIGFTSDELQEQIAELAKVPASARDPEAIPDFDAVREGARLSVGDLVHLGRHRLLVGDSTQSMNVERAVGSVRPACLWTDAPFGVNYAGGTAARLKILNDDPQLLPALLRESFAAVDVVLRPGSPVYLVHPAGPLALVFAEEFRHIGWSLRQSLVWVKSSLVPGKSDYQYRHEPILYGFKPGPGRLGRGGKAWYGGNDASSVFEVPKPQVSRSHPTSKPVRLIELMLKNSTRRGDAVIDPFTGSGSTLIACEVLGRTFVGLELDPVYAEVTVKRWEDFTGDAAIVERANE